MVRLFTTLCGVIALALFTNASGPAADDPPDNTPQRGEMSKVDATGGTFTVKLRDKDGKEFEKIFKLTGEAKCYDVDGKAVEVNAFRAGDQIIVLTRKGEVNELRHAGKPVQAEIVEINPSAKTVKVKIKDENGKEVEKTFTLAGEVRYLDSQGRAADAKIFKAGDQVAVIINKGQLQVEWDADDLTDSPTA
jgi:hypothetical protein